MTRAADPYRDLAVIDSRAPRFNQTVVGTLSLLAVVTGWWWLLALLALQLALGLTLGRRYCLPCLAYFELIQPRFGEGPLEDSRPPRAANMVGLAVLGAASVAYAGGLTILGVALGLLVAALALLAAATGFCTGCEAYKLGRRLTGRPFVSCPIPPRADVVSGAPDDRIPAVSPTGARDPGAAEIVTQPFQNRFERVTPRRVELMLRAEGTRPRPGWGSAVSQRISARPRKGRGHRHRSG